MLSIGVLNNLDEFNILLKNLNLNVDFIKKKIEIEVLWNQLIYQKYKNKLSIDEEKIKENLKFKIDNQKIKLKNINCLKFYLHLQSKEYWKKMKSKK